MKAISPKIIASLKTIASQEKKLRETITISEELNITFGLLSVKEDQAVSAYVKALELPEASRDDALKLEGLVWAIKAINGEDVDHSAFLELEPDPETGKPRSIVFHDYLREMINNWNKELVDMIQSMLWIKARLWTSEAEATFITSDGKKLVDLFQMMIKEQETRIASLPKETPIKEEVKQESVKVPVPEEVDAMIKKAGESVPDKPKMTIEEYNAEQARMRKQLGITPADQGALDDPYKTGEAKPVNIQDVIDERVKAQRNPIGTMAEGVKVRTAPPGYKVGSDWDDTIPPMHGPSGIRKESSPSQRVNVRNPNENPGSISSSVEFITEPVVDPVSPIERHKMQRAKEREGK